MKNVFLVRPKQRLVLSVGFHTNNEALCNVTDTAGTLLFSDNNFVHGNKGAWDSGTNPGPQNVIYEIELAHKRGPPSAALPWVQTPEKVIFQDANNRIVGGEVESDNDFNDVILNLTWV